MIDSLSYLVGSDYLLNTCSHCPSVLFHIDDVDLTLCLMLFLALSLVALLLIVFSSW